jgi:CheY-like chemotaxis protein
MTRILVVDDDRTAVGALQSLLEMDGYEVVGVLSSQDALVRLGAERFDAVVTDLEMPGVHGLEIVRAVRSDSGIPVVVVTGYVNSPASKAALASGANRVLGKPLRYEWLMEALPPA